MNAAYNDFTNTSYTLPRAGMRRSRRARRTSIIDRLLSMIDALLDVLSTSRALRVVRTVATTVCFLAILGVIGGIEREVIGWGAGVVIALIIAAIESLCLYKCR